MEQITSTEPWPLRQIDDQIPKELERHCLKAMSKRVTERYFTASDMADDLRLFLQTTGATVTPLAPAAPVSPPPGSTLESAPLPATSRQSDSDPRPIKVVPKGLRSFDEDDADFFLEQLPGPRDRDGLPDSIRFWKANRADRPRPKFQGGVDLRPLGLRKSSLVKADSCPGLVSISLRSTSRRPRRKRSTPAQRFAKVCPELPRELGLVDSLAKLRRGQALPPEHKVLLMLDHLSNGCLPSGARRIRNWSPPFGSAMASTPGSRDGAG